MIEALAGSNPKDDQVEAEKQAEAERQVELDTLFADEEPIFPH